MTNILAARRIYELRIKPTLKFYSELTDIASEFEESYPEWESNNNPKRTQLKNPDNFTIARFDNNSLSFIDEDKESDDIEKVALKLTSILGERYDIKEYQRIGARTINYYETRDSFPQLVEKFQQKYYKDGKDMFSGIVDELTDTSITVKAIKNSLNCTITMGPMTYEESVDHYGSIFDHGFKNSDKNYIYIDVDTWILEPKSSEVKKLTSEAIKTSQELNKALFENF